MSKATDVEYLTYVMNNMDEAISIAGYLNQHGFFSFPENVNEVCIALEKPEDAVTLHKLKGTWKLFWDHQDCGLFGLPLYVKPDPLL